MSELHAAKDTHAKALAINLEASIYGSFAEIGAGQEVARWFLTVGAASGTVAQTISAYDKAVSDDTYGARTRYVSRERLLAMLDHEYKLVTERLGPARGTQTRFFAFADTVATRNYKGDNEQHGWVGLRFQTEPGSDPSDVLLHVNLMDPTAQQQQEALGVLGVNLLYGAHHARGSADEFLACLSDALSIDRLEIDVLELSGPAFAGQNPRAWCLELVRKQMARAIRHARRVSRRHAARRRPRPSRRTDQPRSRAPRHRRDSPSSRPRRRRARQWHTSGAGRVRPRARPGAGDRPARGIPTRPLPPSIHHRAPAPGRRRFDAGAHPSIAVVRRTRRQPAGGNGKTLREQREVLRLSHAPRRRHRGAGLRSQPGPHRRFKVRRGRRRRPILEPPLHHLYRYLREAGWIVPIEAAQG